MSRSVKMTRSQWIVSLVFALFAAFLLWLSLLLLWQYFEVRSQVQQLEPKLARFYGFVQSEKQLQSAEARVSSELSFLVYPGEADSGALGTSMQQLVRVLMAEANMSVSGSQVLPAKIHDEFTRINISVNVEGELPHLMQALSAIEVAEPLIFIDSIELKPERQHRGRLEQTINAQIRLFSFQVRE